MPARKPSSSPKKDLENNKINKGAYDAMVKALNGIEVEATEVLNTPETSPDNPMPMESLITAKLFNEIFNKYPNTNLFIIMTSLPFNTDEVQKLSIWKKDPKKTQAVIVNGEVYNLKRAIGAGYIAATAVMKNDSAAYDPERTAPSDPRRLSMSDTSLSHLRMWQMSQRKMREFSQSKQFC